MFLINSKTEPSEFGIDSAWLNNKREKCLNTDGINTHQFNFTYELCSLADLKSIQ